MRRLPNLLNEQKRATMATEQSITVDVEKLLLGNPESPFTYLHAVRVLHDATKPAGPRVWEITLSDDGHETFIMHSAGVDVDFDVALDDAEALFRKVRQDRQERAA
jgi:hypothetical protein